MTSKFGRCWNRSRSRRPKSGSRSSTTTRHSGRACSARTRVIGPVPAPSSTMTPARSQSMFRTVVRDSQGLLGARLAIAVPCLRNLPRNRVKSLMVVSTAIRQPSVGRRRSAQGSVELSGRTARRAPAASALRQEPVGVERRGDGLELVPEEADDELVDQPGLLDLGGVAALGDDHLADLEHLVGRPDRAGDVGEHVVARPPDHQGRVGDQRRAARRPSGRRSRGASAARPSSTCGPGTSARRP